MQLFNYALSLTLSLWLSRAIISAADVQIKDTWLLDLRTVCAVMGVVLFGVWWISRWMRGIDDALKYSDERFARLEASTQQWKDILLDIQKRIDKLTCEDCDNFKRKIK